MKNYIPPQVYLYDFRLLLAKIALAAALTVVVYSMLSGSIW